MREGLSSCVCSGGQLNANWAILQSIIRAGCPRKRKSMEECPKACRETSSQRVLQRPEARSLQEGLTPVIALDCEMVGVGPGGLRSSLARCLCLG